MQAYLTNFTDAAESNIRFLAMLTGPFYPILHILKERSGLNNLLQLKYVSLHEQTFYISPFIYKSGMQIS